jgi:hypothetical protein
VVDSETDGVGVAVTEGVAVGDGVGVTFTVIVTPLFQINFFPDFTHVNLLPLNT